MATAMRTSRTSVTAAENVGRIDSYRRAVPRNRARAGVAGDAVRPHTPRPQAARRRARGGRRQVRQRLTLPGRSGGAVCRDVQLPLHAGGSSEGRGLQRRQEMEQAARGHDLRGVEGGQARRQRREARETHHLRVHGDARHQAQAGRGGRVQDRGAQAALAAARGLRRTVERFHEDAGGRPAEGTGHGADAMLRQRCTREQQKDVDRQRSEESQSRS